MSEPLDPPLVPEPADHDVATPEAARGEERAALLRHQDFRKLWLGQAISEIGDGLTGLTLLVVVHERTGSAAALGTLMVLTSLPQLAIGLHAGVFVDRWNRQRVLVVGDLVRAVLVAGLVVVVAGGPLWLLYALAVGQAAAGVFFEPARSALLPRLVPPELLLGANSILQTTRIVGGVLGAALAGLLLALPSGAMVAFSLDAVSFLASAAAIASLASPPPAPAPDAIEPTHRAALMVGMRFLFGSRLLVGLLLTFSITVLGIGAVGVLFVPFVLGELGAPIAALGIIRAAQVVGMVVTGAVVAGASKRVEPHRLLMLGMLGLGLSLALTATVQSWLVLLPLLVLAGAWASTIQSSSATLLQQGAPDALRGRIESALDTLLTLVTMVGVGGAGALADRVGTRPTFLIAGALTLVGGLVAHFALRNTSSADSSAE